jgi:3-methylfumaryl-CoA hydratase
MGKPMTDDISLAEHFKDWVGRRYQRDDVIDRRLVEHFSAMLAPHFSKIPPVPPGLFWCLSPDVLPSEDLGGDGHPRMGLLMPALPLPRRMWAGGELVFHRDFSLDARVTKTSTIENIYFKKGRSGDLAFVTVRHHYHEAQHLVLDERQDIVYRDPPSETAMPETQIADNKQSPEPGPSVWRIVPDPVLLFRYSALTMNGHRIHYDHPYATGIEGYKGVVVHGPLQATLMLNLATNLLGKLPEKFTYRGLAPLTLGAHLTVSGTVGAGDNISTSIISSTGIETMTGIATDN